MFSSVPVVKALGSLYSSGNEEMNIFPPYLFLSGVFSLIGS